jgi:peptidoglycan-associated lipoprotein
MNIIQEPTPLNATPSFFVRNALLITLAGATLSLATGCSHKDKNLQGSGSTAPTITSTVVLNWRTTNATSVSIEGIGAVPLNGTQTVAPTNSTIFRLTAKGEGGSVDANVRVTVRPAAPVDSGTTVPGRDRNPVVSDEVFHASVQDMFFDYDSYDVRADDQSKAAQAAAYLVQHPDIRVLVGGYADERGSAEYNLALGENRANAAKTALSNAGVAPARIRVISYGKEKQFCTESTEACWQENRRAQFTIDR